MSPEHRLLHISMDKAYLIQAIRERGAQEILEGWEGTDEEAIQAVEKHEYQYVTIGPCDNVGPDGRCQGHVVEE